MKIGRKILLLTNTAQDCGVERSGGRANGNEWNTAEEPEQAESNDINHVAQGAEKVVIWVENSFPVHKNASFFVNTYIYILTDRKENV